MSTDLTIESSSWPPNYSRDVSSRQGPNDLEVEIVRDGTYFEGYMHEVVPGDQFRITQSQHRSQDRWFRCQSPIRRSGIGWTRSEIHPVFSFDGLEIMQAPPTVLRTQEHTRLPAPDEAMDVEFKDV